MNQKARFVSQHSKRRFLDFENRYSNWMEGCVEPQHSRAALCAGLVTPHLDDRRSPTIRGDLRSSEAAGSGDPRRARLANGQKTEG